ncbi:flavohemoglobin expression-modulating QEGLA motif protein [Agarilytica rhodophyticola]|uniref:flavohemoglobin expression-modulating QEGLA motif protein n=1 Tax=Agarilytica rhodophyticola TaxID=1737490 RepID=UPI000B343004|nr:flavohemoglobin expression-modulating QEGLA motif protein [Agarilytica rhodophyticola]
MLKLSEQDIIQRIKSGDQFECELLDGSFSIKIESYTPVICTAIHAGHKLRSNLISKCALSETERLYEEDPFTDQLIQAMPITLIARDSRYEYDLNRPIANCIYSKAWGKTVWQKRLSGRERKESTNKHQTFYRVLDALVEKVEKLFRAALVFDIHSYNHLRREDASPTFNLGTEQIDLDRWKSVIGLSLAKLLDISLPNMPTLACENAVFYGRGYMISHINSRFQNTLVLPLEVKKVFMDELSGEIYPLVMQSLNQQFKGCLVEISAFFSRRYTSKKRARKSDILAEKMDSAVIKVDRALYQLAKGLETLFYINPINIPNERKSFLRCNGNYQPQFRYRQLNIDPYQFREQLYRLPVESIRDPSIQSLYRDVIDSLSEKIGLLVKAGRPGFLYESLKYYGEPDQTDEQNARFLLHASGLDAANEKLLTAEELQKQMKVAASKWKMPCKIETSSKLVAAAMVSNSRKSLMIAKDLNISSIEARALVHHELGVHMATTLNASSQRLKVFSLGLPGNTLTQEGLAILNEYLSGNMSLNRLHGLALRVLAVRQMLDHNDFRRTFSYLVEEHHLTQEDAFKLAVRVHRGGGFTKDYLYLNGVSKALELYKNQSIKNLYVGKTGFDYLPTINEMVERQLVVAPIYYPHYLDAPAEVSPILEYLVSCIRPSIGYDKNNYNGQNQVAA